MTLSRRRALLSFGSLSAIPAFGGSTTAPAQGLRFEHGVASGDPLGERVILWTRISGSDAPVEVSWQIATDMEFWHIVSQGKVTTDASRDFTVKTDAAGLKPGVDYVYRFQCGRLTSPIGRTRTLPDKTNDVVLAMVTCSLHPNGYFNGYRAIADLKRVDAVVHLGDYIYEYGAEPTDYGMGNGRNLGRIPEPPYEIITLADYRTRHAQYKRDPDLQAAHARAPWITVFDDHEIANNPWTDGAANHNPEKGEGSWWDRKAAALKAYREWMPIRDPKPRQLTETIYRSFRFGDVAELIMLETRLLARTKQLDYGDLAVKADGTADYDGFRKQLNDPGRQLLGAEQRQWLAATLASSVADGMRWQVFGNQVVMARSPGPDIDSLIDPQAFDAALKVLPADTQAKLQAMRGLFTPARAFPFNLDAWDGYPAERERFYGLIQQAGARAVVVSGDSHNAWANNLADASGRHVAVEMGVTALTSPTTWFDKWLPNLPLAKTTAAQNPEVLAAADDHNGFVRLTLTRDRMTGEWMALDTITAKPFACTPKATFTADALAVGVGPLRQV
ncbi:MAG TPA: alkaline phosphatase D family protein [Asticcacaulis sp.]|nr:alkaline phosphatase D family protein [Asticcacaulis sp.]